MALTVKDRVKETFTTTGTADFTLGGAAAGYQTFAVIGNSNTTYYAAVDQTTGDWEVGIGTYSSTGPTLTRDTVLESSNSGSKVNFAAGSKDVFCTYPAERAVYLSAAGLAVDVLDIGTLGTSTANITTANITAGTVSTTPTSGNDLANKTYVDNMTSAGITYHAPVRVESPTNLNATYNNGTAGVGATLTNAGTQAALVIDGVTVSVNDRVLVYQQTTQTQNGVYTVTNVGSGSTNWVLTRATDADTYAIKSPNGLGQGDAFFVQQGDTGAGETYVCNTVGTITFGTTNITFTQVSSAQVYSAGTGLTLTGTQFSITPVGTASTYGSASQVPVFTTNASGQVSSVTNTAIAISSAAVSGLAASATTDTTDATNITSGTLNSARLNGSYTGITGVGTLTAGTWNGSTIGAGYGGTGQSSYTIGDILYADGTTSLAKLADVIAGNALLSGGVGTAPAWGKVGLQTHIDGTLQVVNGGTGATTLTGYVKGNGTSAFTAAASIPNSDTTATDANTASAIVARDASGNFSAGTITASLSGNATTATTANATTATATFNNSGTGAASGATFNGSTAQTISYNTIGAPSATGSGASGTWGIDITGNAATATSATSATSATTAGSVTNSVTFNNSGSGAVSGTTFNGSLAQTISYNTVGAPKADGTGASGTWGISISGSAATLTTGRTIGMTGDVTWTSGSFDGSGNVTGTSTLANSGVSAGTYTNATVTVDAKGRVTSASSGTGGGVSSFNTRTGAVTLSSSDVTTALGYTPPQPTGTGASGTWGINISGNAATATTADQIDSWPFRNTGSNSATAADSLDSNGITYVGTNISLFGQTDGALYSQAYSSSWQHQIYGDYRTGQIAVRGKNSGTWQSWRVQVDSGNVSSYAVPTRGQSNWNDGTVINNVVGLLAWKNYGNSHVIFDASQSTTPSGTSCNNTNPDYSWTGAYPTLMGWNGSNTYGVRVDSARNTNGGSVTLSGGFVMDTPGSGYARFSNWTNLNGYYGFYSGYNSAHFYPNSGTYGAWKIDGTRNSWAGIEFGGTTLMMNDDAYGFHRNSTGWRFYVESGSGYFPGNVTAYWSDERLKENLRKMDREALDILGSFNAYRFNWNAKVAEVGNTIPVGKEEIGLIAQHVQRRLPDAVVVNKAGAKADATDFDYLTINYDRITPLLVEGVNIHEEDIASLKAKVAKLEALVAKLIGE